MDFEVERSGETDRIAAIVCRAAREFAHYFYLWRNVGCIPFLNLQPGVSAMLTAGAIMTTNIVTSRPNVSIEAAIDTLLSQEISGLPVTDDDGRLVGVITEFALLAVAYDRRVKNHTVSQHMTRDIIAVDIDDPISRVADLCIVHRVRRVPVMKDGRLVGIISRRDVLRALIESSAAVCAV
jgi:CBS domain-containing protein